MLTGLFWWFRKKAWSGPNLDAKLTWSFLSCPAIGQIRSSHHLVWWQMGSMQQLTIWPHWYHDDHVILWFATRKVLILFHLLIVLFSVPIFAGFPSLPSVLVFMALCPRLHRPRLHHPPFLSSSPSVPVFIALRSRLQRPPFPYSSPSVPVFIALRSRLPPPSSSSSSSVPLSCHTSSCSSYPSYLHNRVLCHSWAPG